jgi:predicted ABC-type transport system involved in lysophospholipase L1 biosynthesis ATPase subunit
MDTPPLIEFRNVVKQYGKGEATIRALDRVSLKIHAHEFVSIMGPSGSGKSTAMNILGCLDVPSDGEYLFQGIPTSGFDGSHLTLLRRHMLGFVFQGFNLLPRTSAVENVELPLVYRGIKSAERRKLALSALERVGLKGREGHKTPAGRRTDRQPRHQNQHRDHAADHPAQPRTGNHRHHGHPRRRHRRLCQPHAALRRRSSGVGHARYP